MTCVSCGANVQIGEWPFCPHGFPMAGISVIDDQLEGHTPEQRGKGRWLETLGHEPVWCDGTKSHWKALVDAHNVENIVKHDASYYAKQRRMHDEKLRDEGTIKH